MLIIVIAGGTTGYWFYRFGQIKRIPSPSVVPRTGPTENILLIGSTDRCSASAIKEFRLQCDAGVNGVNSDVVLVLHLDPSTGRASLLSIPRDTFVPAARAGGSYGCDNVANGCANKIDAGLANGANQLAAAIERDFGIPINHFIELNFDSFENVVNALGGLDLYFRDRLIDDSSGLFVLRTGCIYFTGKQALELVRSRHLYWFTKGQTPNIAAIKAVTETAYPAYYTPDSGGRYDGTGDLGRIVRVHLFLDALARAVKARGIANPITDNALIDAVVPNLMVDSSFGDQELLGLALAFRHVNVGTTPEFTLPVVNDAATFYYKGINEGDVVFPSEPQDQSTIDEFLGSTPKGLKLAPSSISVSVIDGTGSRSATSNVAASLGRLGYKIVPNDAVESVGPVSETLVEYAKGHLDAAQRVMSSLSGAVVLEQAIPVAGAEVSVIAGSDLSVATSLQATPTGGGSTVAASEMTSSAGDGAVLTAAALQASQLSSNPNLAPSTSANPQIPAYDPHSCPRKK